MYKSKVSYWFVVAALAVSGAALVYLLIMYWKG